VRVVCPVCRRSVEVEVPRVTALTEFFVTHGDHAFKMYVDEEGFVRRAWPVSWLKAVDVGGGGGTRRLEEFVVAVGGGRAAVFTIGGEKIAEFEAEELGAALMNVEKILQKS